jgi:hypothetical protein
MRSSNDHYANVLVRATTAASVDEAWALITDWPAQSRWIAFTRVSIDREANGVGTRFTGRTQIGPFWFDDPMEVTIWEPPVVGGRGYCKVQKFGPWLLGTAEIDVTPASGNTGGAVVTWKESVRTRGVPSMFNPIVRASIGILFRSTLRKAIAELDAGHSNP